MELSKLNGTILGIYTDVTCDNYGDTLVNDLINNKIDQALQMVGLPIDIKNKKYSELSSSEQRKVELASKLNEKVIILKDFTKGLIYKDIIYLKNIIKKISTYNRKIILISKDSDLFLNLVDHLYVIKDEEIIYETTNLLEEQLYEYIERPLVIDFVYQVRQKGIKLDYYSEFNDLLKAIYRIKQ